MTILCFQPNEAHISEVAIGAQGIGVVSEYYHRFICLVRWNCVYSSTVRAPDCDSGGGGSIPPKHQLFLIVCGCRGVVKRSVSKCLFAMVAHVICNHVSAVRFHQEALQGG